jgi:phosphomannomutase/phosphoglucomutase
LAYATRFSGSAAGVMVTASHNPPAYNGFKFFLEDGSAPIEWLKGLYEVLRRSEFRRGAGILEQKDFLPDYRNALVGSTTKSFRGFPFVADLGNGAAALTVPFVLKAMGCAVTFMHEKIDPNFPDRGPDSSHQPALAPLGRCVRETGALLGAAFDGDADRITFVDDQGSPLPNDEALALMARFCLKQHPGGKVVYDAKSAGFLEAAVTAAGGVPILERTGHVFIHSRMQKEKALLAGEASGHFFLPGIFPGDALYALLVFIEVLKEKGVLLSQIRKEFPPRVTSNDLKVHFDMNRLPVLAGRLAEKARTLGAKVSEVDGVRAVFKDGWGIVRASVTEPVLSCRFEASDFASLRKIVEVWFSELPELQTDLLSRLPTE